MPSSRLESFKGEYPYELSSGGEVARAGSVMALRAAPLVEAPTNKTPALTARGPLSCYSLLINFLSKLAIVGVLPSRRAGVPHTTLYTALLRPLLYRPGRFSLLTAGAFSSSPTPEAQGRSQQAPRSDPNETLARLVRRHWRDLATRVMAPSKSGPAKPAGYYTE